MLAGCKIDEISLDELAVVLLDMEQASREVATADADQRAANVATYFDSYEKRRGTVRLIGPEVCRRGGPALMMEFHLERLSGSRRIDMLWDGIGLWQG